MPEKKVAFNFVRAPYGAFSAAPIGLSVIALIFTALAAFYCTTFVFTISTSTTTQPFGYTTLQGDDGCVSNPRGFNDGPLNTGKAIGIVATVFGVLETLAVICTTFMVFPKAFFITTSVVGIVLAVFAAVVVSVGLSTWICSNDPTVNPLLRSYSGNVSCHLGSTGYVGIIGCLSWAAAAGTLLFMPRMKRDNDVSDDGNNSLPPTVASGGAGPAEVMEIRLEEPAATVVFSKNPDGTTTKTTTTVTYNNGQMLVEKVVEQF